MSLLEYLDTKWKAQINKKENRPMQVKVKEIIEYYAWFDKNEWDPLNKYSDEAAIRSFISKYVNENWHD